MKKYLYKTLLFLSTFAFLTSCQVGLGEGVDLIAPTVKISTPQANDTVAREITVKGSVTDNEVITDFTFNVLDGENESLKVMQFKWDEQWKVYNKLTNSWDTYINASWNGNNQSAQWSLSFEIPDGKSGKEYILEARALDVLKNESKDSIVEVSIVLDFESPSSTIIVPPLKNSLAIKSSYEKLWEILYTVPNTTYLTDSAEIKNLINGNFTIEGQIEEDTKLGSLFLYIDKVDDSTVPTIEDCPDFSTTNPLITKRIINQTRDWKISILEEDFEELDEADPSAKYLGENSLPQKLRIVTEAIDNAGNRKRECQGFFIFWDAADKPWNVFGFGDSVEKEIETQIQVFPGTSLQGQSYDDDGVASVDVEVYKKIESVWTKDEDLSQKFNLKDENYPTYYGWAINAPSERTLFRVQVQSEDARGNKSDIITKYLSVNDINPPKFELTSPSTEDDLVALGNADGNITLKGIVSDDGKIASLQVVKISKENQKKSDHVTQYFDSDSSYWTTQQDGDKLITINLPEERKQNGRYIYDFEKVINIFSDFGVGTTETINSLFLIFKVTDSSGAATIESASFKGDTDAPSLEFASLEVYNSSGKFLKSYDLTKDEIPTLDPFNRNSSGKITDKVKAKGTWKDNSVKTSSNSNGWNKNGSNYRIGDINLEVKGTNYKATKGDETWETDLVTPQDSTTGSIVATITDFAGNKTTKSASYYVNANRPELARINSTNADGSYTQGQKITIVLEFNKKVKYKSDKRISLKLNTGATATFDVSNPENATQTKSSSKHYFSYTVGSTDTEVEKLNVSQIVLPDNASMLDIFVDDDNTDLYVQNAATVNVTNVLNNAIALNQMRSIQIDKQAPVISSVSAISAEGFYNAGKELFFQVEFSKPVTIDNLNNLQLKLMFGTTQVVLSNPSKSGEKTLLFKHVISAGQNATPVEFDSFAVIGTTKILDDAKNELTNFIPQNIKFGNASGKAKLNVDTEKPVTPEVNSTVLNNSIIYANSGLTFAINHFEDGAEKYYSLDGGTTWLEYNGASVSLTRNGVYNIKTYQVDKAGNRSNESALVKVTLDMGTVLKSVTSKTSDGIYKKDKQISIILNFRKPVTITNSKLKLNVKDKNDNTAVRYTNAVSATNKDKIEYSYTVQEGDACDLLEVTDIEFTSINDVNTLPTDLTSYIGLSGANKLSQNREISILTGKPQVVQNGITLSDDGNTLKIQYDCEITKGTVKNISIKQASGYKAPAILTLSQYAEYSSNNTIKNYYESSVNGSDQNGNADVSEKYVLKYDYDTNATALVSAFIDVKADTVVIAVDSVAVNIGSDKKSLEIDLSDTYKLPVKGAKYNVTLDEKLVQNALGTYSDSKSGDQITLQGVEKPVIRVNKKGTTISGNVAVQSLTATVKIDCQTPDANISYVKNEMSFAPRTPGRDIFPENSAANTPMQRQASATTPNWANPTAYNNVFTVGSANNRQNGYKILIRARARVGNNGDWSEDSYESANRTVVRFENINSGEWNNNGKTTVWIRGGDWKAEGVTTPNFPLSWDNKEYNKINAMTKDGNNNSNTWYWVSWNIPNQVYFAFIAGDMPADAATNGPRNWTWSTCAWVGLKELYPCYAGESIYMRADGEYNYSKIGGVTRGGYSYQSKHNESR